MRSRIHLVLLLVPTISATARAQDEPAAAVSWEPAHPTQGSFVYIVVRAPVDRPDISVSGTLAGQPLHFERDRNGEYRALGAIPVNALETIPIPISIERARDTTHRVVRMPVEPGDFRTERLSVDPRFSNQPDSALRERIRHESARSRAVSANSHQTPRMWHGEWVRPRPSRVTSTFGTGRVFNGQIRSRHMGTDLDGDRGDPIRAANRGIVALVGDFYYSGNVVYLDHGAGLVTVYMHMSNTEVEAGQIVEAGDIIGRVGATGRVTGPHLHWTARHGRVSVDPLTLFDLDAAAFPPPPLHDPTDSVDTAQRR